MVLEALRDAPLMNGSKLAGGIAAFNWAPVHFAEVDLVQTISLGSPELASVIYGLGALGGAGVLYGFYKDAQ